MLIKKYYAGTFEWAGVYVKNGYGRLSTVFVAFGIYFGAALYLKKLKMPVVSLLGRSTLGIYYLHYIFAFSDLVFWNRACAVLFVACKCC